jgi:hypothetical protein
LSRAVHCKKDEGEKGSLWFNCKTNLSPSPTIQSSLQNCRPLRLRKDIRDKWDKDDSPLQVQFVALQAILGLQATIQVDWEDLWAALEAGYPDKDVFVSSISSIVKMFMDCLMVKLEDSENEAWTEKFLEEVMTDGRLLIAIGVCIFIKNHL